MTNFNKRMAILARQKNPIFHTQDLGVLWNIKSPNTLYTILKRYTKQKLLYRIFKGFYSLYPINEVDSYLLGIKAMHQYTYISTETILVNNGIISQIIPHITLISSISCKFIIGHHSYFCRQLSDKFLFNSIGIVEKNGLKSANVARAVCDLLYFNPRTHFDGKKLLDLEEIKYFQQNIGYPLTLHFYANSPSRRCDT